MDPSLIIHILSHPDLDWVRTWTSNYALRPPHSTVYCTVLELQSCVYSTVYIIHYIILNNGTLKSNSSIFPRSEGYITQYTPSGVFGLIDNENNEVNISLIIVKSDILSMLGLDLGYTVKYNPLPSGVPLGFALGNSFRHRVIFDRISLVSSKYGYSIN